MNKFNKITFLFLLSIFYLFTLTAHAQSLKGDEAVNRLWQTRNDKSLKLTPDRSSNDLQNAGSSTGFSPNISAMPGVVFTYIGSGNARPYSSAIQSDGKIITAGESIINSVQVFTLVRYTTTGSLDLSFNGTGIVTTQLGTGNSLLSSITIQADGKIIAVGTRGDGTQRAVALVRYNMNGSLDTTFGSDGIVITPASTGRFNFASSVTVQSDNKIVICGTDNSGTNTGDFSIVARYNSNGTLDTTLNGNGYLQLANIGNGARAITVQPDGKIIVGGYWYIVRLNHDGSYDLSFNNGAGGHYINFFEIRSVLLQPDGKIVAAGNAGGYSAARFNTNGSYDTTFNGTGRVSTDLGGGFASAAHSAALQTDGKLILAGRGAYENILLSFVRYNPDGLLDLTFNGTGILNQPISRGDGWSSAVKIQSDNKIVSTGTSFGLSGTTICFTTARFNPNGSLDTTFNGTQSISHKPFDFDGDSKTDISIFRPNLGQWWYLRSSDFNNAAFAFGTNTDKVVPADYTGDGKTDIAFFRPSTGQWFILRSEDSSFYGFPFGTAGDIPAPGDFDGDGIADAAVFRPSQAVWYIQRSSDGQTAVQQFGVAEDKPTVADFDGDGKDDIAIYRPSVSQWWQLRSTAGTIAYQFGTAGDKTIQGDYTGDGKADVGVFRPSTGQWLILRSEDSSFYGFPFGISTDIPSPGDYDGDGTFDAAVFRPSTNTWFYNGSTSGNVQLNFGISGDVPIPNVYSQE